MSFFLINVIIANLFIFVLIEKILIGGVLILINNFDRLVGRLLKSDIDASFWSLLDVSECDSLRV